MPFVIFEFKSDFYKLLDFLTLECYYKDKESTHSEVDAPE